MSRIKPSQISITLATGLIEFCGRNKAVKTYDEATEFIAELKHLFDRDGDEKIDFFIEFEDGETSAGTIKCNRNEYTVFEEVAFGGITRLLSDDPEDQGFRNFVDKDGSKRAKAIEFAKKYDVGFVYSEPTQTSPKM